MINIKKILKEICSNQLDDEEYYEVLTDIFNYLEENEQVPINHCIKPIKNIIESKLVERNEI